MIMSLNTKRESLICLALGVLVTLLGCGEPSAQVSIDLRALVDRAAVTVDRLDQLRVIVSPNTTVPSTDRRKEIEIDLSADDMTFELELAAGSWHFEMVGEETVDSEAPNATYFGDLRVDLEPHSEVDLVIPLFPAGTLAVPVWIAKDTGIDDALVSFVPRDPRDDQSQIFSSTLMPSADDSPVAVWAYDVERILPTGDYDAYVDATSDGTNYLPVAGEPIPIIGAAPGELGIEHGVVNQWEVPFDIY